MAEVGWGLAPPVLLNRQENRVGRILRRIESAVVAGPINIVLIDAGQGSGLEFHAAVGVKNILALTVMITAVRRLERELGRGCRAHIRQEREIGRQPLRPPFKPGGESGVAGIRVVHAVSEIRFHIAEVGPLGRSLAAETIRLGFRGRADKSEGGNFLGADQQKQRGRNVVRPRTISGERLRGRIAAIG